MNTNNSELLTFKQAAEFASLHINKNVTTANIAYLVNYGRISKLGENGNTLIDKNELVAYYKSYNGAKELAWKEKLGADLNWALSFDHLKEADTTKHVHRLHPYKGKYIPQLVEYFLDGHKDEFKTEVFVQKGDIILDPFSGSGTTLVQANELGLHAIGVDISAFNALIANVKIGKVDFTLLHQESQNITNALKNFIADANYLHFEADFSQYLNDYDKKHFPSPEFKIKVRKKEVDEQTYADAHVQIVTQEFERLRKQYKTELKPTSQHNFLHKWFLQPVKTEIEFVHSQIEKIADQNTKNILSIVLSRTMRSCRATTHADLATLINPICEPYYCAKHGKICKPLFSIFSWWERYSKDTIQRLGEFSGLKTNTFQLALNGNAEDIDILANLQSKNPEFAELVARQKIKAIFCSPPYVGLIDYHEQHAYAYDLFGFERNDKLEIGAMFKKQSRQAQQDYAQGIANVLNNCKRFLAEDYHVFLVANDKFNLYPLIAEKAAMKIVNQYRRPVLNRTEKDKNAYSEVIFHLQKL